MGDAVPHRIGRHVHPKARPDDRTPPPTPTGIDYLRLVEARHTQDIWPNGSATHNLRRAHAAGRADRGQPGRGHQPLPTGHRR